MNASEYSAWHSGHLHSGESVLCTNSVGGCMGSRAGLGIVEEREVFYPWREPNRYFPTLKLVPLSLYWPRYPGSFEIEVTRKMSGRFSDVRRCVSSISLWKEIDWIYLINYSWIRISVDLKYEHIVLVGLEIYRKFWLFLFFPVLSDLELCPTREGWPFDAMQ
jgi:hypothetical protein